MVSSPSLVKRSKNRNYKFFTPVFLLRVFPMAANSRKSSQTALSLLLALTRIVSFSGTTSFFRSLLVAIGALSGINQMCRKLPVFKATRHARNWSTARKPPYHLLLSKSPISILVSSMKQISQTWKSAQAIRNSISPASLSAGKMIAIA